MSASERTLRLGTLLVCAALLVFLLTGLATSSPPPPFPHALTTGGGVALACAVALAELGLWWRRTRDRDWSAAAVGGVAFVLGGLVAYPATRAAWAAGARRGLDAAWDRAQAEDSAEAWGAFLGWAHQACPELLPSTRLPPLLVPEHPVIRRGTAGAFAGTDFGARVEAALGHHDDRLFQEAAADGGSGPYRAYLRRLRAPRHRAAAEVALAVLYQAAAERLRARVIAGGILPQLARDLEALVARLRPEDPDTSQVGVVFLPELGVAPGGPEQLARDTDPARNVVPTDAAFREPALQARRERLLDDLDDAVADLAGDVLELEPTGPATPGPRFLLASEVAGTGECVMPDGAPAESPCWAPFVVFQSCCLQLPGSPDEDLPEDVALGARFSYLARPRPALPATGVEGSAATRVYQRMADEAVEAFARELGRALGRGGPVDVDADG